MLDEYRIFVLAFILAGCFLSFLIAAAILYIIIKNRYWKSPDKIIMLLATVTELLWTIEMTAWFIFKCIYGLDLFHDYPDFCQLYSLMNPYLLRNCMAFTAFLAIIRYFTGCLKMKMHPIVIYGLLIFHLVVSTALSITTYVLQDALPGSSYMYCTPFSIPGDISSILIYVHTFYYFFLSVLVTVFYGLICLHWYRYLNRHKKEAHCNNDLETVIHIKKQQTTLLIQGSFIILSVAITSLPLVVTYILKLMVEYKRTPDVDITTALTKCIAPMIDPIITLVLQPDINSDFKAYYYRFLAKLRFSWRSII